MRTSLFVFVCTLSALVFTGQAAAAPPVLTSVGLVRRHLQANWSLPPGVKSRVAEVATSSATSTDGYFFFENVKAFSTLEDAQTTWVYNLELDPGTYFVHVAGYDEPCVLAGLCPFREFSQIMTLTIPAPRPPQPRPRYQASVSSIHPGAIRDRTRNWTYRGDTVRVRFRNATAQPGDGRTRQAYRVCYTRNRRLACRNRRIIGRTWDAWRLRIMPPWAGFVNGRYRRYVEFTWRVERRIVARKRIWVYE